MRKRKEIHNRGERQDRDFEQIRNCREHAADIASEGVCICPEQRPFRDLQGEMTHLLGNVDHVPVRPASTLLHGQPRDHIGVVRHPKTMKGRLHQSPLALVQSSIAGQQSISEDAPGAAQRMSLDEAVWMGDQYLFDIVRMIQQKDMEVRQAEMGDIAKFRADAVEKRQRIAPDLDQAA